MSTHTPGLSRAMLSSPSGALRQISPSPARTYQYSSMVRKWQARPTIPGGTVEWICCRAVLIGAALILAILGVSALVLAKLGVERLPATLTWHSENMTVFVPIGLMIVVSIVATIVLNVFLRR